MYYKQLTTQEKTLVESQVSNDRKSLLVAYLIWFIVGSFGGHRFYLEGASAGAVAQAMMAIVGWLTSWLFIGFFLLVPLSFWLLADLFLMPAIAKQSEEVLREQLARQVLNGRATI